MAIRKCCICWMKLDDFPHTNSTFYFSIQNFTSFKQYLQESVSFPRHIDRQFEEDRVPICSNCHSRSKQLIRLHVELDNLEKQLNEYVISYSQEILNFRTQFSPDSHGAIIKMEESRTWDNIPKVEMPSDDDAEESPCCDWNIFDENSSDLNDDKDPLADSVCDEIDRDIIPKNCPNVEENRQLQVRVEKLCNKDVESLCKATVSTTALKPLRKVRKAALIAAVKYKIYDDESDQDKPKPRSKKPVDDEYRPPSPKAPNIKSTTNRYDDDDGTDTVPKVFKCKFCEQIFQTQSRLAQHRIYHIGEVVDFGCPHCPKRFSHKYPLKNHIYMAHSEDRPFVCEICGKAFKSKSLLEVHINCHTRENKYYCSVCGKSFQTKSYRSLHEKTHRPECKKFPCTVCSKSFISGHRLRVHMIWHSAARPFICHVCGTTYTIKGQLDKHIKDCHSESVYSEAFKCKICEKRMKSEDTLKAHLRRHQSKIPVQCTICESSFGTQFEYRRHMTTHNPELPVACPVCDTRFTDKKALRSHKVIHITENTHKCPQCDKMFPTRTYMRNHLKTHSTVRPFECTKCGKTYRQNSNLIIHSQMKVDCRTLIKTLPHLPPVVGTIISDPFQ